MTTIYVDVLICLNLFVHFFLMLSVAKINRLPLARWRNLLASFALAIASLVVLLPPMAWYAELLYRVVVAGIGVWLGFGFGNIRLFLRNTATFFAVSFAYAGLMIGCWHLFRPNGLVLHNGVVYYNISPLWLVVLTLVAYFVMRLVRKNFRKESGFEPYATVHLTFENRTVSMLSKVDTGFGLQDIYEHHPVMLLSQEGAKQLFGEKIPQYRLLPYQTVKGSGLVASTVLHDITVCYAGCSATLKALTVAVGDEKFHCEFKGLIGYDWLERLEWTNEMAGGVISKTKTVVEKRAYRLHQRPGYLAAAVESRKGNGVDGTAERRG